MRKCFECQEREAERKYTISGNEFDLCQQCFDQYRLQDILENRLIEISNCIAENKWNKALRVLDRIWAKYQYDDTGNWLKRRILSHQAIIYFQMGEFQKALDKFNVQRELGNIKIDEQAILVLGIMNCYNWLNEGEKVIKEGEDFLRLEGGSFIPGNLPILSLYIKTAIQQEQSIWDQTHQILVDIVQWYGIEEKWGAKGEIDGNSTLLLRFIESHLKDSSQRFEDTIRKIDYCIQENSQEKAKRVLDAYFSIEKTKFYRTMMTERFGYAQER